MAKDRDISLNPNFFVPPNVIDVRQENKENYEYVYSQDPDRIAADGPVLEYPDAPVPNAPSGFTLIGQTLRTTPDGRTVVDVELEFADIGAEIDVAVTLV